MEDLVSIFKKKIIENNQTIYRIVEMKDIMSTFRYKRNIREEGISGIILI